MHGLIAEAQGIAQRAAQLAKQSCGPASEAYMNCLEDLVNWCIAGNDWQRAEEHQRLIVECNAANFGAENPGTVLALRTLAEILRERGNELEAKRIEKETGSVLADRLGLA